MLTELEVKERVEAWLANYTKDADFFVERVEVWGDAVRVLVDRDGDIGLEECATISRGLLEVSSPGLSEAMVHPRIFQKRLGTRVEVQLKEHRKVVGVLKGYDGQQLEVQVMVKEKVEGKKRPEMVERVETYAMDDVQRVRVSFDK